MLKSKKSAGFTLVELLVTIAIIGILSTLALIALGNIRSKARDSKRTSDISQLGSALSMYYSDYGIYPTEIIPGSSLVLSNGDTILSKIPSNPTPRNENGCPDADYIYEPTDNNTSYVIKFCLSSPVNNIGTGNNEKTPGGILAGCNNPPSCSEEDICCDGYLCSRDSECICAGLDEMCEPTNLDAAPCCPGTHCSGAVGFCIAN